MISAPSQSRQVLLHLCRPHIAACTAVGVSRLSKKERHGPHTLALMGAEAKTQPLFLLLLWQPHQTTPWSMVKPRPCYRAFLLNI